jgi:hypothetical protein
MNSPPLGEFQTKSNPGFLQKPFIFLCLFYSLEQVRLVKGGRLAHFARFSAVLGAIKQKKNLLSAVCSFEPHQPRRSKSRSAMTLKTAFASSFFCLTFSSGLAHFVRFSAVWGVPD